MSRDQAEGVNDTVYDVTVGEKALAKRDYRGKALLGMPNKSARGVRKCFQRVPSSPGT